jgi:phenylpropionate dioxygenase-like ring-hydroxylating dioxygenase large terminal subunit
MAIIEDRRSETRRQVPFAMHSPLHVPGERYYDRGFYELEKQYLWPRVWQMACRLDEIPSPGDWVEYEICDQSIVVVRQRDGSLKAFHNVCPHRGTQLCKGTGRAAGDQIICPFHGWRWDIDGTNALVYGAGGFEAECLDPEDLRLREVHVDTWGACAWINMDPDALPLRDALSPGAPLLDSVGVENMRVWWWKEVILDANWKVAQEVFHEGYHVMQTHPQLTMGAGLAYPADNVEYTVFENGHARFQAAADADVGARRTNADEFIAGLRVLWEGQDAMVLEQDLRVFESIRDTVPDDVDFGQAAIGALYQHAAAEGIPMPPPGEHLQLWGGEIFLFPNYFMLPMFGNSLAYRSRPYEDDPERCRFEIWSLTTYPEGHDPGRARVQGRYAKDDLDNWGLIPRQDMSNIERIQRGLHSRGFTESRLATQWERAVSNMHEELDRYLAG